MIRKQGWTLLVMCLTAATTQAQEEGRFAITGRVVDAAANPVAKAMVRLLAPGFNEFEVDERTATDTDGRFRLVAPRNWTRMNPTQRQELAVVAVLGDRLAAVQFNRSSAPPTSEVELMLANVTATKIAVLAPDLQPVVGAKVKIAALNSDTIRVDLTEAEVQQYAGRAKKTAIGYVIGAGTIQLPPDLQREIGTTDAKGLVTVSQIARVRIGALTVHTDEFGEQTVGHYLFQAEKTPDWTNQIVLKKTGRLVGQLSSPAPEAIAQREVTLTSFEQDKVSGLFYSSNANIVTNREGKFELPKMVSGAVRFAVKFDANHPTRPDGGTTMPQLAAGGTLYLNILLKPAVRVEGRVLEAASKKPISDIQVRAFLGMGFESTTSDAAGKVVFWMPPGDTAFHPDIPEEYLSPLAPATTWILPNTNED